MTTTEIRTESIRMLSIVVLYDMHTKFLHYAVEGISDKDAKERLNTKANHVGWLVGSLVHQRYELARQLGSDNVPVEKTGELFKDNKGIQEGVAYPPLSELMLEWDRISPVLREAYVRVDDGKLNSHFEMAGMDMSNFDMVTFSTYREANIIGQVALWRRLLGYEGMKYM